MPAIPTKPNASHKHIQQVDYIRAIASVAVALFHLGGKVLPVLKYGWLGVQMFFVLSGFIICWSLPQIYTWRLSGKFISKRLIRIEPPYIISIALAIAAHYIFVINYKPDWFNILYHFAYINNFINQPYLNPVYWTLGIEFQFYIFVALCFPLLISKWGKWFLLAICILPLVVQLPVNFGLPGLIPIFGFGMLYYLFLKKHLAVIEAILFGAAIAVCCVLTSGWLPTGASLFATLLLMLPLNDNALVSFFSKISFSLYLTHDTIGSNLVVFMGDHLPKTLTFKGIEFITGFIVSVTFAYYFYLLVERPCLKLSKQIAYQKKDL